MRAGVRECCVIAARYGVNVVTDRRLCFPCGVGLTITVRILSRVADSLIVLSVMGGIEQKPARESDG